MTKGELIYNLVDDLFPITRSITGNGVRETLKVIRKLLPAMKVIEVPTGSKVLDWEIPEEWNINDAYVKNSRGDKVINIEDSNLHIVSYSRPIHKKISYHELKNHIFTLPEHPDWIPYVTNYYDATWGFCMTHNKFKELKDETYEVCVDSTLKKGKLTYGEYYKKGKSRKEFLISCYVCHPSMANDSLSGVALAAYLAKELEEMELYYSYRFLFIPETIGSITWLARNESKVKNIKYGLVATCLGDSGSFTYKRSRRGNAEIDLIVEYVLDRFTSNYLVESFFPFGSDERQFCSPGFNLPVGSLMRSRYNKFKEYHTSSDNMSFIDPASLNESFNLYKKIVEFTELNFKYINQKQKGEPNLGKRGLFKKARTLSNFSEIQQAYFWILNYSDGQSSLLNIAKRSGLSPKTLQQGVKNLEKADLIKRKPV